MSTEKKYASRIQYPYVTTFQLEEIRKKLNESININGLNHSITIELNNQFNLLMNQIINKDEPN